MDDRYRLRCAQARAALDALALPRDTSPEEIRRHIEELKESQDCEGSGSTVTTSTSS